MRELLRREGLPWHVESAGTESYHIGERPDRRAIVQCRLNGIDISGQRARQIRPDDFIRFDFIYALATDVRDELLQMSPQAAPRILLLLDVLHPGQNRSVPDPWYGTQEDFAHAFRLIEQACHGWIQHYRNNRLITAAGPAR